MDTIVPFDYDLSSRFKTDKLGRQGCVLWLVGLSGSGKSTLANQIQKDYFDIGEKVQVLDGDTLRKGLLSDLGFSLSDRQENIRRAAHVAKLFAEFGSVVIASFITPLLEHRRIAADILGHYYTECFLDTPLDVCEQRDPKGLYKLARSGEIPSFTGISSPFEAPTFPSIKVSWGKKDIETTSREVIEYIEKKRLSSSK